MAGELTVYQIALLIERYDPSDFDNDSHHQWPETVKKDISPWVHAIKYAARSGKFRFMKETYEGYDDNGINWDISIINIDSLIDWMRSRDFKDGFFILKTEDSEPVANKNSEYYAPKLAAAVRAWNEVTSNPEALNGKTPKKALEIWLRKHANEFGLTGKDGNPNALGIEEICKVANWKPGGGASPTPATATAVKPQPQALAAEGRKVRPRPPTPSSRKSQVEKQPLFINDDIPF